MQAGMHIGAKRAGKVGVQNENSTYLVKFETYLVKFETYSVLRDYETEKTTGAPAPAAPASLAPMLILLQND